MQLIQALFDGPIDIVGDVHGEIEAFDRLLDRLGYDADGRHADGRRVVFLGDLTDRGPDSPAVLERVAAMVTAGLAQCIVGNHELNLLRDVPKHGNGWWVAPDEPGRLPAQPVTPEAKARLTRFVSTLPLVLERADLRIVHACWNTDAIAAVRARESDSCKVLDLFREYESRHNDKWFRGEGRELLRREWAGHEIGILQNPGQRPPLFLALAQMDIEHQANNPVAMLTSGQEAPTDMPFWAGGRWRMVERVRWWEQYDETVPVIVGHYWRRYTEVPTVYADKYGPDLFDGIAPHHWMGRRRNVYCVDFSVGGRSEQRHAGESEFVCQLAALRIPEWQVVHDDGDAWDIGPPGR